MERGGGGGGNKHITGVLKLTVYIKFMITSECRHYSTLLGNFSEFLQVLNLSVFYFLTA